MIEPKTLSNTEIDQQPLLDQDQRSMCRIMRNHARKEGSPFTMMDFARITLRATAVNYADAEDYTDDKALADMALQRGALLFVYEALKACDHSIIKEWPEFNTMLQQLEDLGILGLPS